MGWGGPGINRLGFGTSRRILSPTPFPSLPPDAGRGLLGPLEGKGCAGPSASFPHPTRQTSQRGRGQPSPHSILMATRAQNPTPLPPKPLQVAGGGGGEGVDGASAKEADVGP